MAGKVEMKATQQEMSGSVMKAMARSSVQSATGAVMVVLQSAAFALMWSWVTRPIGMPELNLWLAVGLGTLLAMIKGILFRDRYFSWAWVCAAATRTVVLLALAFAAGHYMKGQGSLPSLGWAKEQLNKRQ